MQRARILHNLTPHWGTVIDGAVELDSGDAVAVEQACWLAPAEPSKILAVHLTYQSRLTEYQAKTPPEPSYFMKPPTTLNGHLGEVRRPHGTRFLNYEGEIGVVVGKPMRDDSPCME